MHTSFGIFWPEIFDFKFFQTSCITADTPSFEKFQNQKFQTKIYSKYVCIITDPLINKGISI